MLARRPGFAAAALVSLVLGIGLNTAVFTLIDAVFIRPLPVTDLDSLAVVYTARRSKTTGEYEGPFNHSQPNYQDLVARSRSFEGLALHAWQPLNLSGGSEPERATGIFATANYFDLLGVEPHAGRFFLPAEDTPAGVERVAVLSHGAWSRLFGRDPETIGREVRVNGAPFTIVGIAPRGFKGVEVGVDADLWIPLQTYPQVSSFGAWFDNRAVGLFQVFGRLAGGVSFERAERELMDLSGRLESEFPKVNEGLGAWVRPLLEGTLLPAERDRHLGYGKLLAVAVTLILLMACLNVASLLLVRGIERRRELALRRALGADGGRLVTQLLVENLTLFLLGGLLALPAGRLFLELLWRFRPPRFAADALDFGLDAAVFGFALATALATGLVFGLLPALSAARAGLVADLKDGRPARQTGRTAAWLGPRRLLVVAQVALALVALVGAGLFLQSLRNAHRIELGFDVEPLLVATVAPGEQGYDETRTRVFYRRLRERVEALPGVRSAALSENRLLRGGIFQQQVFREGEDAALGIGDRIFHRTNAVGPGFFDTVGIPIVAGRGFDETIRADDPRVVIVNQTLARRAWPGESAVGKRIHLDFVTDPTVEVIGVARDARYRHVREPEQFFLYFPASQRLPPAATLHVRAVGDPAALGAPVRREIRALAPDLPVADVRPLREFIAEDLWLERASATLLTIFGVLALLLATLGVYGVLAQTVNRRRREIGVRIAVGAGRREVLRLVVVEGLKLIAAGLLTGVALAVAVLKLSTTVSTQLEGVGVTDPAVYAGAVLALLAVSVLSFLIPALRALRTDPVTVLRAE